MEWDKIRAEWEKERTPLKKLAEKYGVSLGTLKSKKSREKWGSDNATMQPKKVATKKKKVAEVTTQELVIDNDELNNKQKLFCLLYVKYFNATQAYQKAYGCDYVSAMSNGNRMIRNDKVKSTIEDLKQMMFADTYIDAKVLLQSWIDMAMADVTDFVDFGVEEKKFIEEKTGKEQVYKRNYALFKPGDEINGAIVQEVRVGKDGASLKLYDKQRALIEVEKRLPKEEQKYDPLDELTVEELRALAKMGYKGD